MNGKLVEDGVRSVNEYFQHAADSRIEELMDANGTRHYRLPIVAERSRNVWLSLVERTLFPDLPDDKYFEPAPPEVVLGSYLALNPGILLARDLRAPWKTVSQEMYAEEGLIDLMLHSDSEETGVIVAPGGTSVLDFLRELIPESEQFGPVNQCKPYSGKTWIYTRRDKAVDTSEFIGYEMPRNPGTVVLQPPLFRPYRTGKEETASAGVEIRCSKTYSLIDDVKVSMEK